MAAPDGLASAPAHAEPRVHGVTVILLHRYEKAGKRALTTFLVREAKGKAPAPGSGAHHWTAPMGVRTEARGVAEQACRELNEELHLKADAAALCDATRFACERGKYLPDRPQGRPPSQTHLSLITSSIATCAHTHAVPYYNDTRDHAVFVARRTGEAGCASYSRAAFAAERAACAAAGLPGCFFETDAMTHVPISELLADAAGQHRRARDIDGAELELRDVFASLLRHAGVRARLRDALDAYNAGSAVAGAGASFAFAGAGGGAGAPFAFSGAGGGAGAAPAPLPPAAAPDAKAQMHLVFSEAATGFRLHVGDIASARNGALQAAAGITHVVNCCAADMAEEPASWAPFAATRRYAFVFTNDCAGNIAAQDPAGQWAGVMRFLQECRKSGGAALVHCWAGVNRSVSTAACFLVLAGLAPGVEDAIELIRASRPQADPMPAYRFFARSFVQSALAGGSGGVGGGSAPVSVQAMYALSKERKWPELLAALAAAPAESREQIASYVSPTSGWTLLHQASHGGNRGVAEVLVEAVGANPRAKTYDGKRASDIATEQGATMLAVWLKAHEM